MVTWENDDIPLSLHTDDTGDDGFSLYRARLLSLRNNQHCLASLE